MRKLCDFVVKYAIYGLIVLMPLFFLSLTSEVFEFNKQYLLVILVTLALLCWLTRTINIKKKIFFIRTPLDLWILIFAITATLSATFSIDKVSSWVGFYGRFSDAVIVLLAVLVMYFVLTNNIKAKSHKKASIDGVVKLFLASSFVAVLVAYLSLFNVWSKIPGLPKVMSIQIFNTISGSFEGLSIFLTVVISLLIGLVLAGKRNIIKQRTLSFINTIGLPLLLILSLLLLIVIDFTAAWIVLGLTMIIVLALAFWTRLFRERVNVLLVPIILLIISIVGLARNTRTDITSVLLWEDTAAEKVLSQMPSELILDYKNSQSITWKTIKEYPVLGSGPGTFLADFTKHKPASFNQNEFWNVRFDKAYSQIMEMAGTMGVLNILAYLLFIVVFILMVGIIFFNKQKLNDLADKYSVSDQRHPASIFPFLLAWLALLIGQFVYWQNTVLLFLFWLFTALTVIAWQTIKDKPFKQFGFSFNNLPELGLVANVVLMILVFGAVVLFYMGGRFYWADVKFSQTVSSEEKLLENSEKSVIFNKYRSEYRRSLSQLYLQNAWIEARKTEPDMQLLERYARGAVQQAKAITSSHPNLVNSWENAGAVYRDSRGLIGGTMPLALDSFNQALELEPVNPFFHRELCRLNLISEEPDTDKAMEYCEKAIELKPTYLDAHVQLALAYEQKGDLKKAEDKLQGALNQIKGVQFERGSQLAGVIAEIYFQLGRVKFNLDDVKGAVGMFEQAVAVMPNHSNARYALGLAYQAQNRIEEALAQFQIVDQLVPGNENVRTLINQLQSEE